MRQSGFYFKSQREFPKDEVASNARFLVRADFIEKLMAGVYSILPLGFRVREKIISIIREEMNALGANELLMPALHPKFAWEPTNRWETMKSVMYQFKDREGKEFGLGATHEEIITLIVKKNVDSYLDLPIYLYQIQDKFRSEERPKSGLLRSREFTMKDLYSFHTDEESLGEFYEKVKEAYTNIFKRCGLETFITEASGGDFSEEYSHEFMVESEVGEDEIFLCRLCRFARNKEIADFKKKNICPQCGAGVLEKVKSIEVGNIFKLGTKFSKAFDLVYKDRDGRLNFVVMGSYGIGIERLIGTIVEIYHDENGIIWPESVAPFKVHLLLIGGGSAQLKKFADDVYNELTSSGVEVLYDDRNKTAGEKFCDADLIGIPWRVVVSEKTMVQKKIEAKERKKEETKLMKINEFIKLIKA